MKCYIFCPGSVTHLTTLYDDEDDDEYSTEYDLSTEGEYEDMIEEEYWFLLPMFFFFVVGLILWCYISTKHEESRHIYFTLNASKENVFYIIMLIFNILYLFTL